jgi:hypothetical protein
VVWFVCPLVCLWQCISNSPLGHISCTSIYKFSIDVEKHRLCHTIAPVHPWKAYRGSRSIYPLILNIRATWTWPVRFPPRPLYPQEWPTMEWKAGWAPEPGWTVWRREPPIWNTDPQVLSTLSPLQRCSVHVWNHKVSIAQNIPLNVDVPGQANITVLTYSTV